MNRNQAEHNNKKQFSNKQADAIFAAVKDKWDQLKEWPDYRGHDEPSLYPKYLHVSALCGMRPVVDKGGVPLLNAVGDEVMEPWVNKGVTRNTGRNAAKRLARALASYRRFEARQKNESANTA